METGVPTSPLGQDIQCPTMTLRAWKKRPDDSLIIKIPQVRLGKDVEIVSRDIFLTIELRKKISEAYHHHVLAISSQKKHFCLRITIRDSLVLSPVLGEDDFRKEQGLNKKAMLTLQRYPDAPPLHILFNTYEQYKLCYYRILFLIKRPSSQYEDDESSRNLTSFLKTSLEYEDLPFHCSDSSSENGMNY